MKNKIIACFFILLVSVLPAFSQKLTLGIESGINFSNLRKNYDYERYKTKPGPINGLVVKYDLFNWLTLQSGVNHISYYYDGYSYYYRDFSSSYYVEPFKQVIPSNYTLNSSLDFARIPLIVKYRTPGRLNFEIGGGAYYAFLTNDEFRGKDRDLFFDKYPAEYFPPLHDWGWILTSSVNYAIDNRWSVFVSGQVTYGHEAYFENVEGKMGSSELTFGVGYKPFNTKKQSLTSDTSLFNITVIPHTGITITNARSDKDGKMYSPSVGFSSGVLLKFETDHYAGLATGVWYDRKGYNLENKGVQPAIYVSYDENEGRSNTSEVQLDYLTFPVMFDIPFGNKVLHHFSIGAYFSLLQNAFAEGVIQQKYDNEQGYQIDKRYFNNSLSLWFKKYDSGLMASYRVDVPLFDWANVFASANVSMGIVNILNNSDDALSQHNAINNQKIRNQSTGLYIGLSIPVKNSKP